MSIRFTYRRGLASVAAAIACAAAPSSVALAQSKPVVVYGEPSQVRSERVSYRDLNLATDAGEQTLKLRIGGAVRRVCSDGLPGYSPITPDYRHCATGAWKDARPQIARAIARAHEIALYGKSSIAATAITITIR